jgi:hypothetical protein
MLRKELIPPEDLVGQVPILQAMLIAVERENTSRLRELAKLIPGLEAKLWEGIPLSTARLVVERQLIHCELAELSEEEEGQSSHTPPDLVQEKEARKEHLFKTLSRLIPTVGKSIKALHLDQGLINSQEEMDLALAQYWKGIFPASRSRKKA